jgi:hypothetical protein
VLVKRTDIIESLGSASRIALDRLSTGRSDGTSMHLHRHAMSPRTTAAVYHSCRCNFPFHMLGRYSCVVLVNISQLAAIRTVHAMQSKACATSSLRWERTEGCCATCVNGPLNPSDLLVNWSTGRIARHTSTAGFSHSLTNCSARPASPDPCMRHVPKHFHFMRHVRKYCTHALIMAHVVPC